MRLFRDPLVRTQFLLRAGLLIVSVRVFADLPPGKVFEALVLYLAMAVWTVVVSLLYSRTPPRWGIFVVDCAVTLAIIALSALFIGERTVLITNLWVAGAPVAMAMWLGWLPATAAAVGMGMAVIAVMGPTPVSFGHAGVTLVMTGALGGLVNDLRQANRRSQVLAAEAAAMAERQRLARIVHDGVLQVLALVERDARNWGARGARLARAAQEQEAQLRALLQESAVEAHDDDTTWNLSILMDRHAGPSVTVSTPAERVIIDAGRVQEIDAAVSEALSNVVKHAGPDAHAWVLVERDGPDIVISIRDNGVGGDPMEFVHAEQRGRMGISHSIRGRIQSLGGQARLRAEPGRGVEWEFRVPVEA